jgi:hypothetical protein
MSNYVNMQTIILIMSQLCQIMSQLSQLFVWQFLDYYVRLFDNPEMNNYFNYVDPIMSIMSKPMHYSHYFNYVTIMSIMFIENYYVNYLFWQLLLQVFCFQYIMSIIAII